MEKFRIRASHQPPGGRRRRRGGDDADARPVALLWGTSEEDAANKPLARFGSLSERLVATSSILWSRPAGIPKYRGAVARAPRGGRGPTNMAGDGRAVGSRVNVAGSGG
ncbi:hypothetical protein JCM18899A_42950 [Nocardioides sp. AN3]